MHLVQEIKIVTTRTARISLGDDGIVRVLYLADSDVDVDDKKEQHAVFAELTGGVKHPFLIQAETNVSFTREAREYGRQMEPLQPFLAFAIVAQTIAYKLLAEFYYKFHKPAMPYRVFRYEEDALEWLKKNFPANNV